MTKPALLHSSCRSLRWLGNPTPSSTAVLSLPKLLSVDWQNNIPFGDTIVLTQKIGMG